MTWGPGTLHPTPQATAHTLPVRHTCLERAWGVRCPVQAALPGARNSEAGAASRRARRWPPSPSQMPQEGSGTELPHCLAAQGGQSHPRHTHS